MNAVPRHTLHQPQFVSLWSACVCVTSLGVLQDNTEHLLRAWVMSGAIVAVPEGPMKRHERSQGSRLQTSVSAS